MKVAVTVRYEMIKRFEIDIPSSNINSIEAWDAAEDSIDEIDMNEGEDVKGLQGEVIRIAELEKGD